MIPVRTACWGGRGRKNCFRYFKCGGGWFLSGKDAEELSAVFVNAFELSTPQYNRERPGDLCFDCFQPYILAQMLGQFSALGTRKNERPPTALDQ